ncbi:threonine efflux protein [Propionibacterium cyclohexanicum]|uniref:Threonine efflux protein n=1 Tax=Propionibacterium cyclohexanicum TaxID=64702 RepID=A0A1H9T0B8_9ACTN|nr:LysE family translocator [Propionibacterium cyclohexanicum]SER90517.1 threonine efflux protein [Propionibacterium cyclohexanicum]
MDLTAWTGLLVTWTLSMISPGPDFLAVLRSGAIFGRRDARWVALGVSSGVTCWLVLTLAGLDAMLRVHPGIYAVMRYLGAGFLVVYGVSVLWSMHRDQGESATPGTGAWGPAPRAGASRSVWSAYRLGLLTNLSNPKALVFFGALFVTVFPAGASAWTKLLAAGVLVAITVCWFTLCATAAGSSSVVTGYRRARRWIDTVLGVVFVLLGLALVWL